MTTLVVGGGIGGLTAAFELRRRGEAVVLIDAGDAPGGVMRTHASGGFTFEDGPSSIQGTSEPFRALVRDVGLESELQPCTAAAARRYFVHRGRWVELAPPPK